MSNKKENNDVKNNICKLLKSGKTLSEISRVIFNTNSTARINAFIAETGIDVSQYNDRYKYMNESWLKEELKNSSCIYDLCKKYNMPRTSVTRYAKKFGIYESKYTRKNKNEICEDYFNIIDNSHKAYWLGFIMADGNMYRYKDSDRLQFSIKIQQNDKDLLYDFANDIGFDKDKIALKEALRNETKLYYAEIKSYNKNFCNNLIKHGICPNKTGKETFPKKIPHEFKKDFIRGFFDGDGHISKECTEYATTSPKMVADMSTWFCSHNIFTTMNYVEKTNIFAIRISKKSLKEFLNIVYYSGCFGLSRKVKEAEKIKESIN